MLGKQNRSALYNLLMLQISVALGLFATSLLFGLMVAQSVGYGACIAIVPTWLFAGVLFRHQGASQAKKTIHCLYVGEGLKLLSGAALFWVVLVWGRPIGWVLMVSFLMTHLSLSIALLLNE